VRRSTWLSEGMDRVASSMRTAGKAGGSDHAGAARFIQRFLATSAKRRSSVAADAPIGELQLAALHHPDPFVRRDCLAFLDHYANEASASVFASALHDPVEFVRHVALHSLACETCRSGELCLAEVMPHLVDVLAADPSPELRHKAIPVLLRLADRDPRARGARRRRGRPRQ
jgi:HEAT repeat protein